MQGNLLPVRVTPKASRNRIEIDSQGKIKVYVTAVPEGGQANQAVCELLAKWIGVPKSSISIVKGHKDREKWVQIENMNPQEALRHLEGKLRSKKLPGM